MEPQTNGQQSEKPPEVLEEETVKIQVGDTSQEKVQPPPKLPPQPSLITPSLTLEEEAQQKLGKRQDVGLLYTRSLSYVSVRREYISLYLWH